MYLYGERSTLTPTIQMYGKIWFLKFHNLQLMQPICLTSGGNVHGYDVDVYYKFQVGKDNRSICA